MQEILFASQNQGKIREALAEFAVLPGVHLISPSDYCQRLGVTSDSIPNVAETGSTYRENALLKAAAFRSWSQMACLADDAGLEVDALDGAPGLYSARFAGPECESLKNNEKLLNVLKGEKNRKARFRSVLCYVCSKEDPVYFEAVLEGEIAIDTKGQGGFGYDNVFILDDTKMTLAEAKERDLKVKTHRVKALKLFVKSLN